MKNQNLHSEFDRLMVEDVLVAMFNEGKGPRPYQIKNLAELMNIDISEKDVKRLDFIGDRDWESMRPVYRHHVAMFLIGLFGFELDDLPMIQTAEEVK